MSTDLSYPDKTYTSNIDRQKKIWILNFAKKETNFISLAQNFANFGHIHKLHKTL